MRDTLLRVEGLWCGGCARALERHLRALEGVDQVSVHLESASARLQLNPSVLTLSQLFQRGRDLGYTLREMDWTGRDQTSALKVRIRDLALRLAVGSLFAMWVMLCTVPTYSFATDLLLFPALERESTRTLGFFALLFTLPVLLYSGAPFHRMSWRWLRVGMTGTDQLVSLGALASWALSAYLWWQGEPELYCDGACVLILLLLTARLLEQNGRLSSEQAITGLLQEAPHRYQAPDGSFHPVSEALPDKTRFLLKAGARVPLDGVIESGNAWCDTSLLNGESLPRELGPGDLLYAGTRLTGGSLIVRCLRAVGERRIDHLVSTMRRVQAGQGSLEGLSERVAGYVGGSLLLASLGVLALYGDTPRLALETAAALLVVGCPCALTLAAPLVVRTVTRKASQEGIAFKSGHAVETLGTLRHFVFDKTGTLSEGTPSLNRILLHRKTWTPDRALALAADLSQGNPHPLSQSLRDSCPSPSRTVLTGLRAVPGRGVSSDQAFLGSATFLRERGLNFTNSLSTSCHLADKEGCIATFEFQDRVNPRTLELVHQLCQGNHSVAVASGDLKEALEPLQASGIPWVFCQGGLSPDEKAERVDSDSVFVGDGVNDSLALTKAGVGIALGVSSPTAIQAADLHLRDIAQLPRAIEWSRAARRRMKIALGASLLYNTLLIPGVLAARVTPGWAALAMGLSSLSVVLLASSVKIGLEDRSSKQD